MAGATARVRVARAGAAALIEWPRVLVIRLPGVPGARRERARAVTDLDQVAQPAARLVAGRGEPVITVIDRNEPNVHREWRPGPGQGEYPGPKAAAGAGASRRREGSAIRADRDRPARLTTRSLGTRGLATRGLGTAMPDRVPLLADDGHAELARRVTCARRRQVAGQGRVQCPQAVRLAGPLGQIKEREQRKRQVLADRRERSAEHAATPPVLANRTAAGAGITAAAGTRPVATATWTATPAATIPAATVGSAPSPGQVGQPRDRPRRKRQVRPDGQSGDTAGAGALRTGATVVVARTRILRRRPVILAGAVKASGIGASTIDAVAIKAIVIEASAARMPDGGGPVIARPVIRQAALGPGRAVRAIILAANKTATGVTIA
jgi:hypothetical protein